MKKALILIFSQTGSTRKICEKIALGLKKDNWQVDFVKIEPNVKVNTADYDIIGIGTPTYFFNPPVIVQDFIKKLSLSSRHCFFTCVTYGTLVGNCANRIRKELIRKRAKDLGLFKAYGADYWLGYLRLGYLFSPNSPTPEELEEAERFGTLISERYKANDAKPELKDPPVSTIYKIESLFVHPFLIKNFYYKTFYTTNKCNSCGKCIAECPTQNLVANGEGKPHWRSNCLFCLSCETNCPQEAIRSALDWNTFTPFMKYNIKSATKKGIPYNKIKHMNGKIEVLN